MRPGRMIADMLVGAIGLVVFAAAILLDPEETAPRVGRRSDREEVRELILVWLLVGALIALVVLAAGGAA